MSLGLWKRSRVFKIALPRGTGPCAAAGDLARCPMGSWVRSDREMTAMENEPRGVRSLPSRRFFLSSGGAFALGVVAALLAAAMAVSAPFALAQSPSEGQALFQEKCVACHTIGSGPLVGPDLKGVTARRERSWLIRWMSSPDKMLAAGDPIATRLLEEFKNVPMPNQGVTETQARSLVAYLEIHGQGAPQTTGAPLSPLPGGDPLVGKELFSGVRRFRNGGPACMACHSIAGVGALGGGALGPDLTLASSKFGDAGLASVLAGTPFPTMSPIFRRLPLTPEEQAHLRAFIQQASVTERSPQAVGQLTGLAIGGTALLLGIVHFSWRHRLGTVRRHMVRREGSSRSPGRSR